jgi:hypothetical protein
MNLAWTRRRRSWWRTPPLEVQAAKAGAIGAIGVARKDDGERRSWVLLSSSPTRVATRTTSDSERFLISMNRELIAGISITFCLGWGESASSG